MAVIAGWEAMAGAALEGVEAMAVTVVIAASGVALVAVG